MKRLVAMLVVVATPAFAGDWSKWRIDTGKLWSMKTAEMVVECSAVFDQFDRGDEEMLARVSRASEHFRARVASVHGVAFSDAVYAEKVREWNERPDDGPTRTELAAKFAECARAAERLGVPVADS